MSTKGSKSACFGLPQAPPGATESMTFERAAAPDAERSLSPDTRKRCPEERDEPLKSREVFRRLNSTRTLRGRALSRALRLLARRTALGASISVTRGTGQNARMPCERRLGKKLTQRS
jgi:hypothetical protein